MSQIKPVKPLVSLDPVTRRREVARLHAEGLSSAQIAMSLGVSKPTVSRDMNSLGIVADSREEETLERRAKVKKLLDKGMRTPDIANELGISKMTVIRDRELLGFMPTRIGKEQRIASRRAKVKKMIGEGMTCSDVASKLGVTNMMVLRDCEALGVASARSRSSVAVSSAERRATVSDLHHEKVSIDAIAEQLGVSHMTVRRDLAALELK